MKNKVDFKHNEVYVREFQEAERNGDKVGREEALEKLYLANRKLIASIAKRYVGRVDILDIKSLLQEGFFGLVRAAQLFDPQRGAKFSTYATSHIRKKIQVAVYKAGFIRLPARQWELLTKVFRAREKLYPLLEREPTVEEISDESGLPIETCLLLISTIGPISSLEENSELTGKAQEVGDPESERPYETIELQDEVSRALGLLSFSERKAIEFRYLKGVQRNDTLQQMNISGNHLRSLINSSRLKLAKAISPN